MSAEKAKAVPAVSADKKNSKKQELEKKKAEEIRREEQRRAAEEERILHRKRRKHYSMIARYVVYTVVVCYVFLRLTDNFSSILRFIGRGVGMIGALLMPLFWGFVLAYILEPVVEMLEDRLNESAPAGRRRGSRHGLAVAITCAAVLLVLVVILSLIVSAFSRSLQIASLDDLVALVQSFAGTLQSFQQTIMNEMQSHFSLGETASVTLSAQGNGGIKVHGLALDQSSMTVNFFRDVSVTVTAEPKSGGVFSGWSDGVSDATRTFNPGEVTTLTATFK